MEQPRNEHNNSNKKKNSKKSAPASLITPTIPSIAKAFLTNLYKLKFSDSENNGIHRYSASFAPNFPEAIDTSKHKVLNKIRKPAEKLVGHFLLFNGSVYARRKVDNEISLQADYDGVRYQVKLRWTNEVKYGEDEHQQYFKVFIKEAFGCLKLQKIGNKYFDPGKKDTLIWTSTSAPLSLDLWVGHSIALHETEKAAFVRLDVAHRVAQKQSVLHEIKEWCDSIPKEVQSNEYVSKRIKGKFAYAFYSGKVYRVDGIDFTQSPKSSFSAKEGENVTYADYFLKKYKMRIQDMDQPLLIHCNDGNKSEIRLVPELCGLTGITEEMRKDNRLVKEIAEKSIMTPQLRVKSCKELLDKLNDNKDFQALKSTWKISIDDCPEIVEGAHIIAGKLVMQSASPVQSQSPYDYIDLDDCKNLDRDTQRPMLSTPPLQKWGIYYDPLLQDRISGFNKELQGVFDMYRITYLAPTVIKVGEGGVDEWLAQAARVPLDVQAIIIILKADKGKASELYNVLKSFFIAKHPVITQFVLSRTVERSKNLRSICCKVAVQLCSKLGGVPWEITDAPLIQFPIMVLGLVVSELDSSPLRKSYRILSLVSTLNKGLSRYFSTVKVLGEEDDYTASLRDAFARAITSFKASNKCYPKLVVVYKLVQTGKEQALINVEQDTYSIKKVVKAAIEISENPTDQCKIVYILTKERFGLKLYESAFPDDLRSPFPGALVTAEVARKDRDEFFLTSQRTSQGFSTPTHYCVAYSDDADTWRSMGDSLIGLTYKLCYLYYNVSGPVRVPAPLEYSNKLNRLVMQRATISEPPPTPHQRLENLNLMYYL
eukprot:TRINITY_DN683_c0_g2_i8.p1 TRINITY_DN683_c0_g2~~TRINITY_DN683_c0_g2_i8.p1  ORF type:complete len:842 (-),score=208.06 TRINITY_DN683_c0_g2_i8:96-2570(-)